MRRSSGSASRGIVTGTQQRFHIDQQPEGLALGYNQDLQMTKRSVRYFWTAIALSAFGLAALGTSTFAYWRAFHRFGLSSYYEDWGSFGAFVSGIAGTAIALATLVALAVTFALQARELENSRHAVERQIFDNTFFQLLQRFNGIVSSLASISTRRSFAKSEAIHQAVRRRRFPFHHGTSTAVSRSPEASTIGRCARRSKRTWTSFSVTSTVAGMSMRSRKMTRACASA